MITFDKVIQQLDQVHRYGHYVSATCVFHSDSKPSMLVFEDGWFRCLGCGKAGTLDDLWRGIKGWCPTPSTYREPATFSPLHLPNDLDTLEIAIDRAHDTLDNNLASLGWYLRMRGVEGRVDTCKLGWMAGWYTIPIYSINKEGHSYKLQGAVARAGSHIQHATGQRFSQPRGQEALLYCPDRYLLENTNYLVVVYGMFDTIALSEMRIPSITTTAGKGSFNPDWLDSWRKRILVVPDKGEEETGLQLVSKLGWRGRFVKVDWDDDTKDPADCLQKGKQNIIMNAIRSHT